jgi:hypothetical protein
MLDPNEEYVPSDPAAPPLPTIIEYVTPNSMLTVDANTPPAPPPPP